MIIPKKKKVAIIDDDPIFGKMLVKHLTNKGFTHVSYYDSPIKFLHDTEKTYELLFVDFKMKEFDGLRLARLIRKQFKKSVIILVTSDEKQRKRQFYSRFGIDKVIYKKDGFESLSDSVNRLIFGRKIGWFFRFGLIVLLIILVINYFFKNDLS